MRIQQGSQGFRYGDTNKKHVAGVQAVSIYLDKMGYNVKEGFLQYFTESFIKRHRLDYDCWKYDIAAWDKNKYGQDAPDIIVEVDGEKHSKKIHKIKDGIAENYIKLRYPKCKFVRIEKEDALWENWLYKKIFLDAKS